MIKKYINIYQIPLVVIVLYLVSTLLLYIIGPFKWVTYHHFKFWFLQILYIVALVLGWQFGLKNKRSCKKKWLEANDNYVLKILHITIFVNFIFEFINLFRRFNFSSFDFIKLFERLIYGIFNMGESYNLFQEGLNSVTGNQLVGGSIMSLLNYFWDFFSFAVLLLAFVYFRKLRRIDKIVTASTVFIIIISYLAIGTNIGVFRIMLVALVLFLIKLVNNRNTYDRDKWKKKMKLISIILIISIVAFMFLFSSIMKSRGGILNYNSEQYNVGGIGLNKDSILFSIVPSGFHMLLVSASSYLTQGYYGMSLCLTQNWIPTFGIGSSSALTNLSADYFTDYFSMSSYQTRIGDVYGWDPYIQWHSMYSWFANDFSFIGVIFIMFIIGLLFSMAFKDSIETKNPFSKILVCFFSLMVFFIPCNNQLFQSTYTLFSFFTVLMLWLYSRGSLSFLKKRMVSIIGQRNKQK